MNKTRRTLLKGMLSGGTLLAFGIPTAMSATKQIQPFNMRQCQLLLGDGFVGQAFLRGGKLACGSLLGDSANTLSAVKITNQLDTDPIRIMEVLAQSSDTRWIAVMDYANAAIFNELVRASDARLLLMGSHSARLNDAENISVRHVLTNSGRLSNAGKLLAENLISNEDSFSIVENFLEQPLVSTTKESIAMENLSSFQSSKQSDTYLHCAGITAEAGSQWKLVHSG